MEYLSDCDFCQIARGDEKARIVCETSDCLAFYPLKPIINGHTLVIPKRHVKDLWSADPIVVSRTMDAVRKTGQAIITALNPDGMNVINSAGDAASQTVYHLHIHVVPRWRNDPIGDIWPASPAISAEDLDETAEWVRSECARSTS